MLLAAIGTAVLSQLGAAVISIDIGRDSALVAAEYELRGTDAPLELTIIRFRRQRLRLPDNAAWAVESMPGLYRLTGSHTEKTGGGSGLTYTVSGDLSRIPVALPAVTPPPDGAVIRIEVRGLSQTSAWNDAFPRLEPQPDGSAIAVLESLPAFLRTPPDGREWSANRIADMCVALLVLFATLFWWLRQSTWGRRARLAAR